MLRGMSCCAADPGSTAAKKVWVLAQRRVAKEALHRVRDTGFA